MHELLNSVRRIIVYFSFNYHFCNAALLMNIASGSAM